MGANNVSKQRWSAYRVVLDNDLLLHMYAQVSSVKEGGGLGGWGLSFGTLRPFPV